LASWNILAARKGDEGEAMKRPRINGKKRVEELKELMMGQGGKRSSGKRMGKRKMGRY